MTDSSTPHSPAAWTEGRATLAALGSLLALLAALLASPRAAAEGIAVSRAELSHGDHMLTLAADFDLAFTPTLEDALSRGLTLYFSVDFSLVRPRWYWLDEKVVEARREYRLSHNALTRQYRLSFGALHQNFPTLAEALGVLSRLRSWEVAESPSLKPGADYRATLLMQLDTSRLPKPFQVNALASKDWQLPAEPLVWTYRVEAP